MASQLLISIDPRRGCAWCTVLLVNKLGHCIIESIKATLLRIVSRSNLYLAWQVRVDCVDDELWWCLVLLIIIAHCVWSDDDAFGRRIAGSECNQLQNVYESLSSSALLHLVNDGLQSTVNVQDSPSNWSRWRPVAQLADIQCKCTSHSLSKIALKSVNDTVHLNLIANVLQRQRSHIQTF